MERSPPPPANPKDVESLDAIIRAAYLVISGPSGQQRDWDRERSLFLPGATLIPTTLSAGTSPARHVWPQILDVEGFIARSAAYLANNGFYEKEIARRTEEFGSIAHVWSTYESRHTPEDREPFMRGINSIQLFHDTERWWIMSIYWQHETAESRIPAEYLA